jgi:hypothetical protein
MTDLGMYLGMYAALCYACVYVRHIHVYMDQP